MPHSNGEPKKDPNDPDYRAAYVAGKQAIGGLPRWKFFLLIILAVVVGDAVEKWLISRYSFSEFKAFLFSLAAVMLLALLARSATGPKRMQP